MIMERETSGLNTSRGIGAGSDDEGGRGGAGGEGSDDEGDGGGAGGGGDGGGGGGGGGGQGITFEQEVEDIVRRGVEEDVNPDNIAMEVNGRKFAHDKTFGDCAAVMLGTVLASMGPVASRKEAFTSATRLVKKWKALVKKFTRSQGDQARLVQALETFVGLDEWRSHRLMMPILKCLYDEDLVEEDTILDWATDAQESGSEATKALVAECKQLIDMLQEEEDDDDDE